jgi:hypothetical protein
MNSLCFAFRQLLKSPVCNAWAVLSLCLGIGLNSTLFSALDAAFLRPVPFRDGREIVRFEWPSVAYPDHLDTRTPFQSTAGQDHCRGL